MARWTAEGKRVAYVICTNGNKGTSDPEMPPEKLAGIRRVEESKAAGTLGVGKVVFLEHDDQTLEDTPEFRKEIVRAIRTFKPDIVAAPDPYRRYVWHRDHRITGQVTLDAVFPFARDYWAYPDLIRAGLMPHKVKELLFWGADKLNYYSDISRTFRTKMAALRCHKSQVGAFPKEWEQAYKNNYHAVHAAKSGYKLAEAFYRVQLPL